MTSGLPLGDGPVLSKTTTLISFMAWMASPFRMRTPFSAPMPLPTIKAVGVARPKAHGQAMTSTAMVADSASDCREQGQQGMTGAALKHVAHRGGEDQPQHERKSAMAGTAGTNPVTLSRMPGWGSLW